MGVERQAGRKRDAGSLEQRLAFARLTVLCKDGETYHSCCAVLARPLFFSTVIAPEALENPFRSVEIEWSRERGPPLRFDHIIELQDRSVQWTGNISCGSFELLGMTRVD